MAATAEKTEAAFPRSSCLLGVTEHFLSPWLLPEEGDMSFALQLGADHLMS